MGESIAIILLKLNVWPGNLTFLLWSLVLLNPFNMSEEVLAAQPGNPVVLGSKVTFVWGYMQERWCVSWMVLVLQQLFSITGEIVPALRAKSYVTKVLKCLELINLCLCVCVFLLSCKWTQQRLISLENSLIKLWSYLGAVTCVTQRTFLNIQGL